MATKLKYQGVEDQLVSSSLHRQAIINGNFDVWQRGTSFSPASGATTYTADRFVLDAAAATTNYTVTRQDGTGVTGSRYCIRFARNNGATNTNNRVIRQGVETPNTVLMRGQKWTFSFWARSGANYSPTSATLNFLSQWGTGTNQSPNAYSGGGAFVSGTATLTTTWQKFTFTSAAVLDSTANEVNFVVYDTPVGTAGAADYYEITQVQLCAGDVALPFMPKSFEEELRACLRYYQSFLVIVEDSIKAQTITRIVPLRTVVTATGGGSGYSESGASVYSLAPFQTTRAAQTLVWNAEL